MSKELAKTVGKSVFVITNDGKNYVGVLKGVDQVTNIILEDCYERSCTATEGIRQLREGLKIIRGDSIALVGELDEEKDAAMPLDTMEAPPMKPVTH